MRARWTAAVSIAALLFPGQAGAHDKASTSEAVVQAKRHEHGDPARTPADGDDLGPELRWSRLVASSFSLDADMQPTLVRADLDRWSGLWLGRSGVLTGVATAAGSLVTDGFVLVEVRRQNVIRQRHFMQAFFGRGGVTLVWRIEF